MSDIDKLEKKYEKGNKAKDIRDLAKTLEGSGKAAFGIYPSAGKRAKREGPDTAQKAISQAVAGFRSQWSGLDDKGQVGVGRGTPGIYYNTAAIPALAGLVDEKYAPDFAVEADKKAGRIREAVRRDMGIDEPKGALEHFAYAGGEMLGQLPVPASLMAKLVGSAKKMGTAGKIATAPIEYLSPTVDPKAINYGIGTAFGGTVGTVGEALSDEEPAKKALGGLIQKYENGGRVGRFRSAVDKAIDTLKQKKGTGEQMLRQLETTPGVKQEELEFRGIKQKLQKSPKITQEELKRTAQRNKPPIPQRRVLGAGVPEDYKPQLTSKAQAALDEHGIEPVVNPEDRRMMSFMIHETGDIVDAGLIKSLYPDEMGFPVGPDGKVLPEAAQDYKDLINAVTDADRYFQNDLMQYEPKYQRYSQPGGENYREVLVHLPFEGASKDLNLKRNRLAELLDGRTIDQLDPDSRFEAMNLMDEITSGASRFTSSHYDTPNILTHFRVSDRVGPNGEKVLYVDEIQSDWHQGARNARKDYIKTVLFDEKGAIRRKAVEEMVAKGRGTDLTDENLRELEQITARLTRERKTELEQATPKDFGYRTDEDNEQMRLLRERQKRIREQGLTPEETAEYFQPGRIVKGYGGHEKVISFNSGEGSPAYKQAYEKALERALSVGADQESAMTWARKKAADESKHNWSVTVISVDPTTGRPRPYEQPRTHSTSPNDEIIRDLANQHENLSRKVPDAPFKENWHELAVKEIMDMAAKDGYARVAFSPGIEQVKRYSSELRQALDEVRFVPDQKGGMRIAGLKGTGTVFAGDAVDGIFVTGPAKGKSVSEVFGSNIAKQIDEQSGLSQQGGSITGNDLAVGGEGMKSFYDKRLPDFIRKYAGKEFDAKTDYLDIQMTEPTKAKPTESQIKRMMEQIDDGDDDELMERVMDLSNTRINEELARRGINRNSPNYDQEFEDLMYGPEDWSARFHDEALRELAIERMNDVQPGKTLRAFTIDVTPQMREKITTEGQRLFAATPAVGIGAAQVPQQPSPPEQPVDEEQSREPQDEPQGFQEGGRVGRLKAAAKKLSGGPKKSGLLEAAQVVDVLPKKEASKNLEKFVKPSAVKRRVFHGSNFPEDIVEDNQFAHYRPDSSEIHWFSESPDHANEYTYKYMENEGDQGAIFPANLQIKKPLELPFNMNDRADRSFKDHIRNLGFYPSEIEEWASMNELSKPSKVWQYVNTPVFREIAKKKGFDGLKVQEREFTTWGAFEPTQIKSQFNRGSYDVNDPDIGYARGGPVGLQEGGRVGKLKEASEMVLRVLHGSPTKVRIEKNKNMDVTTDPGYAIKRAQDKMGQMGQEGPPMINKFDIPAKRVLRFEETYSPEDVALMRRFFNKLPEGKAMTGEEIYDAAMGKDYVMEGIAKAGGKAGYERPAAGSGGKGNWYRITEQEELTRKARGGLAQLQIPYR
jgi:hypothetical protein